jgi:hypothetical protein
MKLSQDKGSASEILPLPTNFSNVKKQKKGGRGLGPLNWSKGGDLRLKSYRRHPIFPKAPWCRISSTVFVCVCVCRPLSLECVCRPLSLALSLSRSGHTQHVPARTCQTRARTSFSLRSKISLPPTFTILHPNDFAHST